MWLGYFFLITRIFLASAHLLDQLHAFSDAYVGSRLLMVFVLLGVTIAVHVKQLTELNEG